LPGRNLQARYNICPTTTIDAVIQREARRELVPIRWGLVPSWWKKKAKETPATFNARAETVAEKPMFLAAFKRTRCLIPASGYYEWQTTPTGKQPYYFTARDGSPLTIAGLWDEWKDIESGEPLKSCTMIITTANDFVSKFHERMPVLLQQSDFDNWLTGNAGTELLRPAATDFLQSWPVSKRVNSSRAPDDDPTLVDSVAAYP
jgi:putative SOS response-associated peptidase YedK